MREGLKNAPYGGGKGLQCRHVGIQHRKLCFGARDLLSAGVGLGWGCVRLVRRFAASKFWGNDPSKVGPIRRSPLYGEAWKLHAIVYGQCQNNEGRFGKRTQSACWADGRLWGIIQEGRVPGRFSRAGQARERDCRKPRGEGSAGIGAPPDGKSGLGCLGRSQKEPMEAFRRESGHSPAQRHSRAGI
jgi:hypothetical protein